MPLKVINRLKNRHAPKGSFSAHVLTLMTGTTIAQAIPIAISPILTRLYSPSDFGALALFSSVVSIVAIIATGRYELAIMLPEEDDDAFNIFALSILISSVMSMLSLLIIFVFNSEISTLLGNKDISKWLYWVPFSVLLTGFYQAFNYWSSRKKQFERLAVSRISQSAFAATANLSFGYVGLGVSGLIGGSLIGQSCATGVLGWQVWRDDKSSTGSISKNSMMRNAKRYREFPLINSLHAFSDTVQTSGIVFVISAFFGSNILGFYSLTLKVLRMPLSLIGSSVSQVFFQKASQTYNDGGDLHVLLKKTMIKLSMIALPVLVIVVFFAPEIFALCFGKTWREAGLYAQILSPWIFINFIVSPISQIPIIVNKQKSGLAIGLVYNLSLFVPLLLTSYLNRSILIGLCSISMCASFVLLYYVYWVFKISKRRVGTVII